SNQLSSPEKRTPIQRRWPESGEQPENHPQRELPDGKKNQEALRRGHDRGAKPIHHSSTTQAPLAKHHSTIVGFIPTTLPRSHRPGCRHLHCAGQPPPGGEALALHCPVTPPPHRTRSARIAAFTAGEGNVVATIWRRYHQRSSRYTASFAAATLSLPVASPLPIDRRPLLR
ncbi:hypothetical protein Drorol1_Dr00017856, partial [Drosera rotundifolia]